MSIPESAGTSSAASDALPRQKRKYTKRKIGPRKSHKGLKARIGLGRIKKTDHLRLCSHFLTYFTKLALVHGRLAETDEERAALFSRLKLLDLQMISAVKFVIEELKNEQNIAFNQDLPESPQFNDLETSSLDQTEEIDQYEEDNDWSDISDSDP